MATRGSFELMPAKMGICSGQRRLSFHPDCCYFFKQSFLIQDRIFEGNGYFFYSPFLKAESVVWWVGTVKNYANMGRHFSSFWCKSRAFFFFLKRSSVNVLVSYQIYCVYALIFAHVGPISRALELMYEWKADSKVFSTMQEGATLQCSFLCSYLNLVRLLYDGLLEKFLVCDLLHKNSCITEQLRLLPNNSVLWVLFFFLSAGRVYWKQELVLK